MLTPTLLREFALVTTVRRLKIYVPPVYRAIRRFAPEHVEGKDTLDYIQSVYEKFAAYATSGSMTTLELGPGPNLGVSQLFAARGHHAVALDIEDLRTHRRIESENGASSGSHSASMALGSQPFVAFVLGMAEHA